MATQKVFNEFGRVQIDPDILYKLAGDNTDLSDYLDNLLQESYDLKSLRRAMMILSNLKNEEDLHIAEMSFQSTAEEVLSYLHSKAPSMNRRKAAQYVYTMQNLIFALGRFPMPDNEQNKYVPQIYKKYSEILRIADTLGVKAEEKQKISNACFSYEFANDFGFRYLDNQAMKKVLIQLKRVKNAHAFNTQNTDASIAEVATDENTNKLSHVTMGTSQEAEQSVYNIEK